MSQRAQRATLPSKAPSGLRFALAALVIPLCLALLASWLAQEYAQSEGVRAEAQQSSDREITAMALLSALKDAETAQRGFLITGDAAFLRPYAPAEARVRAMLHRLESFSADHAVVGALETLASAKFAAMARMIAVRRTRGLAPVVTELKDHVDQRLTGRMRYIASRLIARERLATATRLDAYDARADWISGMVLVMSGVTMVVLAIGAWIIWRYRTTRYRDMVEAFEAAERNRTILDSTIDAIVIIDPRGMIETANAAATAMVGYAATDLDRRDIAILSDLAPGFGDFHERIGLIDGDLRQAVLTDRIVRHRDGREIPVDIAMGVMALPSGDHIVAAFRDISERKRAERMKDDLISTVSHEIRTPLTSIVGALGLLRAGSAGALSPDAGRLVVIADNNARRLIRLINDMLDIDRIENGRLTIARAPIDIRTVLRRACEGSAGLARASGITLDCDAPADPVIVAGDGDRLIQVVTNLLSNAIRLSPAGGTVDVAVSASPAGKARVTVDDRGPGVPMAFRDRIFGRFERAERQQDGSGTGLGLAISREIVARHDGEIWFEDRPGGGARFAFTIDLLRPAAMSARDNHDMVRILIAEQDPDTIATLVDLVTAEGGAGDVVTTTAGARDALRRHRYDAVILDPDLPDEGGLALARFLREGSMPSPVPAIAIGTPTGDDPAALEWIDRPVDPSRMATALRAALERSMPARPVVLHLEDDKDMREVVASSLGSDALVLSAHDLASARAILQTRSPDVAIIDIHLPDGSGLDLIPMLVDAAGIAVPTIIYSAQDVPADIARSVGAVLVKSCGSLPDLKAMVRRLLRGAAGRAAKGDTNPREEP